MLPARHSTFEQFSARPRSNFYSWAIETSQATATHALFAELPRRRPPPQTPREDERTAEDINVPGLLLYKELAGSIPAMDSPISIASHNQEAARCDAKRKRYLFGAQGRLLTVLITTCGSLGFMLFGMFMRDHLTNMQDMTKASLQVC